MQMNLQWYVYLSIETNYITNYLNFHDIDYIEDQLWDDQIDEFGRQDLSLRLQHANNSVLVISGQVLLNLLNEPRPKDNLQKFLNNNNYLWICSNTDGLIVADVYRSQIEMLDSLSASKNIFLFFDGLPSPSHWLYRLSCINISVMPVSWFLRAPIRLNQQFKERTLGKDFLCTTILKKQRIHRNFLFKELQQNDLLKFGHVKFSKDKHQNWIGQRPKQNDWADGYPSMDLYNDSCLEIVPETLYKNGYFVTEKTIKPIMAELPFLILSTCGYLKYLKTLGFKTFDSVIDESYDQYPHVQDRVKKLVDQLKDIIKNGSKEFYSTCQPILEHNQKQLFEIYGSYEHKMDGFYTKIIEEMSKNH